MRFRLPIVLLLLLVFVVSACGDTNTPKPGPSAIPQIPPAEAPAPGEAAEPEAQEDDAAAAEQEDSSQAVEPETEAAESSDTGHLPTSECIASPDMYTWSHTLVSKEEGSRGWTCQGKLIIKNTSGEPLLLDYHLDRSAGTYSLAPWVTGEVALPTATPNPDGAIEENLGAQYHEWLHPRMVPLAPGKSFEFDSNLTVYDDGLYTYKQITRILLRRNLAGCIWFTPNEAQFDWVDILTPCLGAPTTGGG